MNRRGWQHFPPPPARGSLFKSASSSQGALRQFIRRVNTGQQTQPIALFHDRDTPALFGMFKLNETYHSDATVGQLRLPEPVTQTTRKRPRVPVQLRRS